jgi:hypothetical protein
MKRAIALILLLSVMAAFMGLLSKGSRPESRNDFKIGVWYDVVVNRSGVSQPLDGLLVKADREWIVLAKLSASAHEVQAGNWLLTNIPYFGSRFQRPRRVETTSRDYRWIRRDVAQVVSHNDNVDARVGAELEPHSRTLGKVFFAYLAFNGKPAPIGVGNDFATDESQTLRRTIAMLNSIPTDMDDGGSTHPVGTINFEQQLLYFESKIELPTEEVKLANARN